MCFLTKKHAIVNDLKGSSFWCKKIDDWSITSNYVQGAWVAREGA